MNLDTLYNKIKDYSASERDTIFNFLVDKDSDKVDAFLEKYKDMKSKGQQPDLQTVYDNVTAPTTQDAVDVLANSGDQSYQTVQDATKVRESKIDFEPLMKYDDNGMRRWNNMSSADLASWAANMGYNVYKKPGDPTSGIRQDVFARFVNDLASHEHAKEQYRNAHGEWGDVKRAVKNGNIGEAAYELGHNIGGAIQSVFSPRVQESIEAGRYTGTEGGWGIPTTKSDLKDFGLDQVGNLAESIPVGRLLGVGGGKIGAKVVGNKIFPLAEAAMVPFGMEAVDALAYDADENPDRSEFSLPDAVVGTATNVGTPFMIRRGTGRFLSRADENAQKGFRDALSVWGEDPLAGYDKLINDKKAIMEVGTLNPSETAKGKALPLYGENLPTPEQIVNAENILAVDAAIKGGDIDLGVFGVDPSKRSIVRGISDMDGTNLSLDRFGVIRTNKWDNVPEVTNVAAPNIVSNETIEGTKQGILRDVRQAYASPEKFATFEEVPVLDRASIENGFAGQMKSEHITDKIPETEKMHVRNQAIADVINNNPELAAPQLSLFGVGKNTNGREWLPKNNSGKWTINPSQWRNDRSVGAGSLGFLTNSLGEEGYGYSLIGMLPWYGEDIVNWLKEGEVERKETEPERVNAAKEERAAREARKRNEEAAKKRKRELDTKKADWEKGFNVPMPGTADREIYDRWYKDYTQLLGAV